MRAAALALTIALITAMSVVGCVATVRTGPPPARVEIRPAVPYPEAVWVEGHWEFRHGEWMWSPGYWARAPFSGAVWIPGHWREDPGGWRWIPGHWR